MSHRWFRVKKEFQQEKYYQAESIACLDYELSVCSVWEYLRAEGCVYVLEMLPEEVG